MAEQPITIGRAPSPAGARPARATVAEILVETDGVARLSRA